MDPRALLLAPDLDPAAVRAILAPCGFRDVEAADRALQRIAATPEERLALAEVLPALLDDLARAGSPDRGLAHLERLTLAGGNRLQLMRDLAEPAVRERAVVLLSQSRLFADALVREPHLLGWLGTEAEAPRPEAIEADLRAELRALAEEPHQVAALHRRKRRELLAVGFRDHVLGHPLGSVAREIAAVAEAIVDGALAIAEARLRRRFRDLPAGPLPFAIVALGKLGGAELNYSSDIDLVFVHDDAFAAGAADPGEVFDRLGREVTAILGGAGSEGEGELYRVDLRLRPEGGAGALSRGLAATARYYATLGRTWERQALLKARVIAGDRGVGARFLEIVTPFVHRRYLEVAAIAEIKALKRRIEARGAASPTRDVKEGPGGIRDIEFTVQFLQLLHGGELPELRVPGTLPALDRLEQAGLLEPAEAALLRAAYAFLRTVEHRLQTLEGRQTHVLPPGEAEETDLAHRLGLRGPDALARLRGDLDRHGAAARAVLDRVLHALFPDTGLPEAGAAAELILDPDPPADKVARVLGAHGFKDPARALADLRRLATERSRILAASGRTRTTFASLLPGLLRALAAHPDRDGALERFERATATLGGKAVFYQLLAEHPGTLDLFVRVAADSEFLTGLMTRSPGAFDEVVDFLLTSEPVTVDRLLERIEGPQGGVPASGVPASAPQGLPASAPQGGPASAPRGLPASAPRGVPASAPQGGPGSAPQGGPASAPDGSQILTSDGGKASACPAPARRPAATDGRLRDVWLSSALLIGVRDIGERWNVANVQEALSALADATLRALAPADAPLAVLALGKLGGRELSYGSDLDLVAAYPGEGPEAAEAAARAMQALVRRLEGLGLYSLDLRLRPEGEKGPVAVSFEALGTYYAGPRAAVWERLAATKLRAVAGDLAAGRVGVARVLDALYAAPLPKDAAEQVRAMRSRLEGLAAGPLDLKRAPGGLLDIEFVTAWLKLQAGGAPAEVRDPGVVPALHALARLGRLPRPALTDLLTGYQLFRKVEARLRIARGRSVSVVPDDPADRRDLARRLGYVDTKRRTAEAAMTAELKYHMGVVRGRYRDVLT